MNEDAGRHRQLALFSAYRAVPAYAADHGMQVRLDAMELNLPPQPPPRLTASTKLANLAIQPM